MHVHIYIYIYLFIYLFTYEYNSSPSSPFLVVFCLTPPHFPSSLSPLEGGEALWPWLQLERCFPRPRVNKNWPRKSIDFKINIFFGVFWFIIYIYFWLLLLLLLLWLWGSINYLCSCPNTRIRRSLRIHRDELPNTPGLVAEDKGVQMTLLIQMKFNHSTAFASFWMIKHIGTGCPYFLRECCYVCRILSVNDRTLQVKVRLMKWQWAGKQNLATDIEWIYIVTNSLLLVVTHIPTHM